jgi:hypothetical protein
VEFLEQVQGPFVLLDLKKVLSCCVYGLALIFLPVVHNPLVDLQQLHFGTFKVIPPHLIVGDLQLHINTELIHLDALLHGFLALRFGLFLLNEVSQTHLSYACVGLSDISFDLCFGGCRLEGVLDTRNGLLDSLLISLYRLDSLVNLCQLHIPFVGA